MRRNKAPFIRRVFLRYRNKSGEKTNTFYKIFSIFMCLLVLIFAGSCEINQHDEDETAIHYAVIDRLDRQNDVYYRLAKQIDAYIDSDDKTIEEQQFKSFCRGVNCFVRNENNRWIEYLYSQDEDIMKMFHDVISATAWGNFESFSFAGLNETALNELKDIFYQLAEECDRGVDRSFASCFATQDFDTETYSEAAKRVQKLLSSLKIMTE